jgi:hypothetical protein
VGNGYDPDVRAGKTSIYRFTLNPDAVWELTAAMVARS